MSVPVQPGREQARDWALHELSKREYQEARPSPITRALTWLWEHLTGLGTAGGPAANLGTAIVVGLLVVLVIWAVRRSGGLHRNARGTSRPAMEDRPLSSAEHTAAADRYAAAGAFDAAVVERFRAIVRELEERTVINPQRGRTADEIAASAGSAVPQLSGQLTSAARTFDDVRYGGQPGREEQDAALRELARALRGVRVADLVSR